MDKLFVQEIGDITKVILSGRLDATSAPALMEELKEIAGNDVKKIVFYANELEYISSAGLRAIIFAKQKIGAAADVFLIGAQATVTDVITMSGLDNFLYIQDSFDA